MILSSETNLVLGVIPDEVVASLIMIGAVGLVAGLPIWILKRRQQFFRDLEKKHNLNKSLNKGLAVYTGQHRGSEFVLSERVSNSSSQKRSFYYTMEISHRADIQGPVLSIYLSNPLNAGPVYKGGTQMSFGHRETDKILKIFNLTRLPREKLAELFDESIFETLRNLNGRGMMTASYLSLVITGTQVQVARELTCHEHFQDMLEAAEKLCRAMERVFGQSL